MDFVKFIFMVVDGYLFVYCVFFVFLVENFMMKDNQYMNVIYGFLLMLVNFIKVEQLMYMVIVFDILCYLFCIDEYFEYKVMCFEMFQEFCGQILLFQDCFVVMLILVFMKEGIEVDDIFVILVLQGVEQGYDVLVVFGDCDIIQFVNDEVMLFYLLVQGVFQFKCYDFVIVQECYGVWLEQYFDIVVFVGEISDNFFGVLKVGEKMVVKWLMQFGFFDEFFDWVEEIKGVVGGNFCDYIDDVCCNCKFN